MPITVNTIQAKEMITDIFSAGLVPMIHSSPGMGKSALMAEIAAEYNLKLIDLRLAQMEVTDLNGFPDKNMETGRFRYLPMEHFPLEGDEIPEGYEGWLLFFDELTSADRSMQKGAYKVILDKMIGDRPIHKNTFIAAAGNLLTDNAIVEEMGTALQSRMVHMTLRSDHEAWLQWASSNGINQAITSFIAFKPTALNNFDPNHSDKTFACQRTWEFAHKLIAKMSLASRNIRATLAGTISEGTMVEFMAFTELFGSLPKIGEILNSPGSTHMPSEPGVLYALTGSVGAYAKLANLEPLMTYVKRMPAEFQVVCLREIIRRNKGIAKEQPILDWVAHNGVALF